MIEEYDEDSLFCSNCTEDPGLRKKIVQQGSEGLCDVCKQAAEYTISFDTLATWVESIWQEWFTVGPRLPFVPNDSDLFDDSQRGTDADYLISDLIQCPNDDRGVVESITGLMSRSDHYLIMSGGAPLIDDQELYEKCQLNQAEVASRWESFVLDLKHHTRYLDQRGHLNENLRLRGGPGSQNRRFSFKCPRWSYFNERAIEFFDNLFEDLGEVHHLSTFDIVSITVNDKGEGFSKPVVGEHDPGSLKVFRARKAGCADLQRRIIDSPDIELSNPPDSLAAEGRMNPRGISYFYGALDRETCVAELRPSISEIIISAEFELKSKVRLLDLTLLSHCYDLRSESMFDDDYREKMIHRKLLRQLHTLIAQPVLDGNEFDYLPTQAMSEYLARKANPRVDGIIFKSVQNKIGKNVVFFPHVLGTSNHSSSSVDFINRDSVVSLKADTLEIHNVNRIEHSFDTRKIVDGEPDWLPEDYVDDDDWGYL